LSQLLEDLQATRTGHPTAKIGRRNAVIGECSRDCGIGAASRGFNSGGAGGFNGSVGNLDLNNPQYAAGNQYFTVVPAPGTLGLIALAGLAAAGRRRA
jgi:hypothetical protein